MGKYLDLLLSYLKERSWWKAAQPVVLALLGYLAVQLFAYASLQALYGYRPSIRPYLRSYVFAQVTVAYMGLLAMIVFAVVGWRRAGEDTGSRVVRYVRENAGRLLVRFVGCAFIVLLTVLWVLDLSPNRVRHIPIRFIGAISSELNQDALAYLVFELNRRQQSWYFEIEFDPLSEQSLTSTEYEIYSESPTPVLCLAEQKSAGLPLLAITARSLGEDTHFARHRGSVSVITTADHRTYIAPMSVYEYLGYSIIVQSILIHLDTSGGGVPDHFFEEEDVTHGGVFQFTRRPQAFKSAILAARLNPEEVDLLMNAFGVEYVRSCEDLLSMTWFKSENVQENLRSYFDVGESAK